VVVVGVVVVGVVVVGGVVVDTWVRTILSTRAKAPPLGRPTSLIGSPAFSATLLMVKLVALLLRG
jgi:hypothetical protein